MDIHVTDDQIGRYFRRRQLGLRLLSHGARTQTVQEWSGLTRDQLVTLRRRWTISGHDRRRGPSPSSFEVFFRSARTRRHAALFASLCQIIGAVPRERGREAARKVPSLESGELLCEAYELFKEWALEAKLEFEQIVLLAVGVVAKEAVELCHCSGCNTAALTDRLGPHRPTCSYCRGRLGRLPGGG